MQLITKYFLNYNLGKSEPNTDLYVFSRYSSQILGKHSEFNQNTKLLGNKITTEYRLLLMKIPEKWKCRCTKK